MAYILGNLTTNFEEARQKLCEPATDQNGNNDSNQKSCFLIIAELAVYYLEKDSVQKSKKNASAAAGEQ